MSSEKDGAEHLHLTIEPTFATEGALWFPDLLAGDPTGALPVLLSASIILNIRNGWHKTSRKELADMPKLQMLQNSFWGGLRIFMQVLAVNVGATTYFYEMPTALLIYWISSTNIATFQTWFMNKYMFAKPPLPTWSRRYTHYECPQSSDPYRQKLL
jgi:inner membrane protein COX18